MNWTAIAATGVATIGALALGGCTSQRLASSQTSWHNDAQQVVALAAGPSRGAPGSYTLASLGAGDSIGRVVLMNDIMLAAKHLEGLDAPAEIRVADVPIDDPNDQ